MKTTERIKIADEIAPAVSSRDVIRDLKKRILCLDSKTVHLDFENVECISRSVAHELLRLKKALKWRLWPFFPRTKISFINTNEDISKMLNIVASSRTSRKKRAKTINIQEVDFSSLQHFPTL